jgi:hypothetical protein
MYSQDVSTGLSKTLKNSYSNVNVSTEVLSLIFCKKYYVWVKFMCICLYIIKETRTFIYMVLFSAFCLVSCFHYSNNRLK